MPNRARTANAFPMRTPTSTQRAVDDPVALYVHAYVPVGLSEARWAQVRDLVMAQVLRLNVGLETMRRCIRALTYLASWCVDQHVALDVEHVLDPDTVERYCIEVLSGTDAAVSRVRGELRRLGRTLTATTPWEPLPAPLSRTKLPSPYCRAELAVIERDIARQATKLRRTTAQAMWLLGLGAGLDGRWNTKVRGTAVKNVGGLVVVEVSDPAARRVVVRAAYATALLELAAAAGEGLLIGERKVSKNSSSEFAADIIIDQGRIAFTPARLRSTWLVAHLEAGTQLPTLLQAAGMRTFGSLGDLLGFVRPLGDGEARTQLAAYRYGRLKAPGTDGVTRWKHPVKNGTLRSRQVPASMRKNRRAPLVDLPEGVDLSTVTAGADRLPLCQPCLYGTTAWTIAEGKRQLAETANSFFHGANGAMTDIGRGYTRLLDSGRLELFVTFTIFGYNRSRIHVWLHDHRMLPAAHPDALPPIKTTRAPRKGRAKRFSDLGRPSGHGPPAATAP